MPKSKLKHNIGAKYKLSVESVITVRGRKSYVVTYDGLRTRVPLFDWQENEKTPKQILCRLVSINEFGFPTFEQVPQERTIELVEQPKTQNQKNGKNNTIKSFFDKVKSAIKVSEEPQIDKEMSIEANMASISTTKSNSYISESHNIAYYRWSSQEEGFEKWFISTGGVKRRLQILLELSKILASYHRQNKVYKDLALEYIDVKINNDDTVEVSVPQTDYVYSGFGDIFIYASLSAPEVVNRRMPNTPLSDCYSFAILAHELLEFCHPFIGDKVFGNSDLSADAFRGKLAWIDNPKDSSNRLTRRYFDCIFTTDAIRDLFKRTFDDGKDFPMLRPSIFEWVDALQEAVDHIKYCRECNTTYLYFGDDICPFCDKEPTFPVVVELAHLDKKWDNEQCRFIEDEMEIYDEPIGAFVVNSDTLLKITSQHLLADSVDVKDALSVQVFRANEQSIHIMLNPLNGFSFYASTIDKFEYADKIDKSIKKSFTVNDSRPLVLSLNKLNSAQRVIVIKPNL
jgi:hypothetical protein